MKQSISSFLLICFLSITALAVAQSTKPRTIVTTDGEVDDQDSFIQKYIYFTKLSVLPRQKSLLLSVSFVLAR